MVRPLAVPRALAPLRDRFRWVVDFDQQQIANDCVAHRVLEFMQSEGQETKPVVGLIVMVWCGVVWCGVDVEVRQYVDLIAARLQSA
ncbi:hypothetical protein DBR23_22340 [Acidovorax sp. HMWF018]|uniref:hypothetical protein n=1 Tax=Acidovorax sp. HMWF018 TaxID=2056855 RepID=UPI000D3663A9|nr:hypothetical protein [Acidovorax sp. HMWF018]PTT35883.1 hypothetical protein DBR23_22340 [Acidovorax sp. HMWF018]